MTWFNKSSPLILNLREKIYTLPTGISEWSSEDWKVFYAKKKSQVDLRLKTQTLISLDKKENESTKKLKKAK